MLPLLLALAPETILVVDDFVVGSRRGGKWVAASEGFAKAHARQRFMTFGIGAGGSSVFVRGFVGEETDGGTYLDTETFDGRPALAGAMPRASRPVQRLAPSAVYEKAARGFLARKGVAVVKANVVGVWRTDLDGDGTAEVLVQANRPGKFQGEPKHAKGSYSLVLLRALRGGRVVETALEFAKPDGQGFMEFESLRGIADLDGDGRMEVLTTGKGYEWNNAALWGYRRGVATKVLGNGVGH